MGDVDVATQNELALGAQLLQVRAHGRQEAELCLLALRPGRAAGKVSTDEGQAPRGCVKTQLQVAPFGIEFWRAKALAHVAGWVPGVDAHAGVAFFFCAVKVAVQARDVLKAPQQVGHLGFQLLHTNTIGPLGCQPVVQPFAACRANAVEVEAG